MQINFCLAARDPNGNPSSGINRGNGTVIPNFSTGGINNFYYNTCANEKAVKDLSRWPFESYLNIWVVSKICGGNISGYATGQTGPVYNGISILSSQMSASKVTLAHEVGHMFNLYHTFNGDGTNVTQGGIHYCPTDTSCADNGDRICYTPPHKQGYFGSFNPCKWNMGQFQIQYNELQFCLFRKFQYRKYEIYPGSERQGASSFIGHRLPSLCLFKWMHTGNTE